MSILITRPYVQALEIVRSLEASGFSTRIEPLLELEAVKYEPVHWPCFDVVIFTSSNAVQFLEHISPEINCVCVGDATAKAALRKGFKKVHSCDSDVYALIGYIASTYHTQTRFLYISGETIRIDLTTALERYFVHRIVVYRTVIRQSFSPEIIKQFQCGGLDKVALFSRRTAQAFEQCVNNGKVDLSLTKLYCLSPNVARPCQRLGFQDILVALRPTQQAIIKLLREG